MYWKELTGKGIGIAGNSEYKASCSVRRTKRRQVKKTMRILRNIYN
jgi:hypothetical protein